MQVVARDLMHHPVRERLNALAWDGSAWLRPGSPTYLGVTDTAYSAGGRPGVADLGRRPDHASPACKADHVLILEGAQGVGKSTAASTLALDGRLFADEIADLGTKDAPRTCAANG